MPVISLYQLGVSQAERRPGRDLLPQVRTTAGTWLPLVRLHRSGMAWDDLTRLLRSRTGQPWTLERMKRAACRHVRDRLLPATVLDCAPRRTAG